MMLVVEIVLPWYAACIMPRGCKARHLHVEVHRRQVWCKSDAATLRVASPQLLPSRAALTLLHLRCTERVQPRAVCPGEGKNLASSPGMRLLVLPWYAACMQPQNCEVKHLHVELHWRKVRC